MKNNYKIILGPALFAICMLLIPSNIVPYAIKGTIGLFLWMAAWWITMPVAVAVTAFLPVIVNAVFGFIPMGDVIPKYASDLVFLLLGANIITLTWEVTGLNERVALSILSSVGPSIKTQLTVWFLVAVVMSIFLPNVVVAATLTPIALSMLKSVGKGDVKSNLCAANLLLAVGWGAGLGGFGSPLGGGMNLVSIGYIEQITGQEYMYIDWVWRMMPFLILISIGCLIYITRMKSDANTLPGAKEYFEKKLHDLGKMTRDEKLAATVFVVPVVLAFARPLFQDALPSFTSSYAFIVCALFVFLLPGSVDGRMLTWKYAQPKLSWGLFYTLAGGLALGGFITKSGASDMVADLVMKAGIQPGIGLVAIFIFMATFLASVSSNNAACAISIPIVISITQALGLNPIGYIYLTSVGGNLAYTLPTATLAVPVANGVEPKYMLKHGIALTIIAFIITLVAGILCLKFLPFFSA